MKSEDNMKMKKVKVTADLPVDLVQKICKLLDWSAMSEQFMKQKLDELQALANQYGIPMKTVKVPLTNVISVPGDTPAFAIAKLCSIDFGQVSNMKIKLAKPVILNKLKNDPTIPTR